MADDDGLGEVTVTMRHPDGQSLFFTESIIQFLMNRRDKRQPFYLGHWLASLNNADLGRLVDFCERSLMNLASDQPAAFDGEDDVAGVTVYALSGETQTPPSFLGDPTQIGALCFLASMEEARRTGWVTLKGAFSMTEPGLGVVEITDKGFREMPEFLKRAAH